MSISRRQLVFAGVSAVLFGGVSLIVSGCGGGSVNDSAKMDPAQEKILADQKKATEEFYASKNKKK